MDGASRPLGSTLQCAQRARRCGQKRWKLLFEAAQPSEIFQSQFAPKTANIISMSKRPASPASPSPVPAFPLLRPLAPFRIHSSGGEGRTGGSVLYTAEQEAAIEEGLAAMYSASSSSVGGSGRRSSVLGMGSGSSSSSSGAGSHPLRDAEDSDSAHALAPCSPWSFLAAYRMYASIPAKMRDKMPLAQPMFPVFFGWRRLRAQLLVAFVTLSLLLVLFARSRGASEWRPVCHHNSASCLIIPDDNLEAIAMPVHPTVLYYNTHGGCNQNMRGVMRSLGVKVDLFNPKQVAGYGMDAAHARYLIESGHVDYVCSRYDIIIIGDTIPHGRALLESLLEKDPMKQCRSKIVVEMTNRFDWDIVDKGAYYNTISELVQLSKTTLKEKLFWVANNNVEKAWLEHKVGVSMPMVRVLRPLGVAPEYPYPLDLPEPDTNLFAARQHYSTVYNVLERQYNIPLAVFPFGHKYGGPKNLLRFKAFIDIPYEYSTMKLYENIAFGIPMIIPTPRFLEELYDTGVHRMLDPYTLQKFPVTPDTIPFKHLPEFPAWSAYMDYYAPEFAPYVYHIDSFEELVAMSEQTPAELDFKNVRTEGPVFYARYREEILGSWLELFRDMGYTYQTSPEGGAKIMMQL